MMKIYTLVEAARETHIPETTLKRACEEGLVKANKLAGGQWRIAESALEEALNKGLNLKGLTKKRPAGKKQPMPVGLKRYAEARRKSKQAA